MKALPETSQILGIVMPVFNEAATLHKIVEKVLNREEVNELIMVDDCSTDETWKVMTRLSEADERIRIFRHEVNQGKGAALRTGFSEATSEWVLIQDADLEYDPDEYPILLQPVMERNADVVFGSRFRGGHQHRVLYYWHSMGNCFLTTLSNMFTNMNLTDMETCYKLFRRDIIQNIKIKENRFGFEPEITAKVARMNLVVFEVAISYYGRTYEEGKKIGWKDGVRAVWCILKYGLFNRS